MGGAANSKDETRESLSDSKQDSVGASLDETLSVEDSPYQRETTDQVISHITQQRSKSFFQRNISQIEKGGLRSSLFTMFSGLLGAGLLSLPKVISFYGVTLGMLSLLLFGMISWYTYIILNQLIMASNKRSYANVCAYYLGRQAAKIIIHFMIFSIMCSGILYASVSWQFLCVILKNYDLVPFVYKNEVNHEIDQSHPLTAKWRYICSAAMGVAIIPLVYQRTLGSLRYFSMYTFLAMCSTIVVTVVEFPEYFRGLKDTDQYEVEWWGHHFDIRWFQGWATMMLAYYSQVLFFYVRGEMMNKTEKRIEKMIWIMTAFSVVLFGLFSCLGYLSLGEKIVPSLFTLRKNIDPLSADTAMKIAQLAVNLAALIQVAFSLFPAREQVYIFYKMERSTRNHLIMTLVMIIISFSVPAVYPDITAILGLVGGLMMGTVGYSLPLMLKIFSSWNEPFNLMKLFNYVLLVFILVVQIMSAYVSIFIPSS